MAGPGHCPIDDAVYFATPAAFIVSIAKPAVRAAFAVDDAWHWRPPAPVFWLARSTVSCTFVTSGAPGADRARVGRVIVIGDSIGLRRPRPHGCL